MKRIAVGGIVHETNTFAPQHTPLEAFSRSEGAGMIERWRGTHSSLGGALRGLDDAGCVAVPLLYATAMPSGLVTREAYAALLDGLLERLRAAAPLDGVLLVLHGAMVAEGQDDCEGEILQRVRAAASCPVVSVLDMHGSLTDAMVAAADGLVAFNQNPHVDTYERGLEAAVLLGRILDGSVTPTKALVRLPLLLNALATGTARLPLSAVHEQADIFRQDRRVLNVSIMGGFAYSDVCDAGVSILVTTDNDAALAQEMAQALAAVAWQHREAARDTGVSVQEAVRRAVAATAFPVVLADIGDNVGGGSPGDGTFLLRELLAAGAQDAVVVLADPQVVEQAAQAGIGAEISVSVGGKVDSWHGEPVSVRGVVELLSDGRFTTGGKDHFANIYGTAVEMGRCARLRVGGVTLLLTERKTPPGDLAQLRSQGITPEAQKIIVVKSTIAFRGAYEPIAAQIIEVDTPGLCATSLQNFPYQKLCRPRFPLDDVDDPQAQ
jgi:microcystin degradation protein MlrC